MHKLCLYPSIVFVMAGSLFAAEPLAGTWKQDTAKSKYGGGADQDKAPKDRIQRTLVFQERAITLL